MLTPSEINLLRRQSREAIDYGLRVFTDQATKRDAK
jgi:hypothetical protein